MKKILLQLLIIVTGAAVAMAQAPQKFNYQGIARNTSGTPLASTSISLRLTIHDGSSTGTTVYQETFAVTTNAYGLYDVAVGTGSVVSGTFSSISWSGGAKYIQVEIDPAGGSSYTTLGTNQLLSVPYAMYAASSGGGGGGGGTVTSVTAGAGLSGGTITTSGTISLPTMGGVSPGTYGSGTQVPQIAVDAYGRITSVSNVSISGGGGGISGSGTTSYVPKFTSATALGNSQIYDNSTSVGIGTIAPTSSNKLQVVNSSSSTGQHAVHGIGGTAPTGFITLASGVYGESNSGIGVSGVGASGDGVFGYSTSGTASGVEGHNSTAAGVGVTGSTTGAAGVGGVFDGGAGGYGVFGTGSADGTLTIGGFTFNNVGSSFESGPTSTSNISGHVLSTSNSTFENHGIYAQASGTGSSANVGIFAAGTPATSSTGNSYGVYGYASGGAVNYGVYGSGSGTGYAGYFSGPVSVTGLMSKGGGSFKIDHPLDPENKYLYHSFVESPDMMNIYNGNITTDANGDAEITLPDYFESLNKDFRYQLTVIGTFAQAIVSKKVSGNKFSIKTNAPSVEVSWQVTGIRHDKFAEAHRITPEVEKEGRYKGLYLHASEWGMPASKSIDEASKPKGLAQKSTDAGNAHGLRRAANTANAKVSK